MDIESVDTDYLLESSSESENMFSSSSFQTLEKFYLNEAQNGSTYQYNQALNNSKPHFYHETQLYTKYMNQNKREFSHLQNEDVFQLSDSESFSDKINILTNLTDLNKSQIPQINAQMPTSSPEQRQRNFQSLKIVKSKITIAVDINKDENQNFQKNNSSKLFSPLSELYNIFAQNVVINNEQNSHFNHFSYLNSHKIPTKVQLLNSLGTLEVFLNSKENVDVNQSLVIQKLSPFHIQESSQFSQAIQKYSSHLKLFQEKQDLLKYNQITNSFSKKLETKFNEFEIIQQQKLKEISKTNCFYSYSLFQFNVKKFEIEQTKIGYSESLLALLGLDYQQAKQYILRKGIFEYTNQFNIQEQYFKYISKLFGEDVKNSFKVALQTFDGFELNTVNIQHAIVDIDSENPFLGYNQVLFVNTYQISENLIQNLISLRQKHKEQVNQRLIELEEDLYYSMESNIFLQKYYKNQTENYLMYSKRAKYRNIN
ncbi:hypothetical protein TTHERM_00492630 (macronuclear) [Tetrahymena thermophila SB210]|uniref:Uncharacterized protein n=1 Tax=Tetrahymena thermophila (strain SB210) TaxID=312017 RepID=I7MLR1_TETTS|nr:hypothetical protein TTHERM_00492630 [Tetrahymena thermophila SB210]EAS02910.1 hypothetical protein TTHERM_00492630 [Tetrahymena thermophila SB210]|eukprot:XP_001023155.1 hypothetical protein TTHERM_00492630 [Tetrahymena thermophila SB210]